MGKRWNQEDFPRTNWNLWKHFWQPALGMYGILQMTMTRDAFFLHGAGVGGGSLVYANTLLVPPDEAFRDPRWVGLDWKEALRPHYATAMKMLGATESTVVTEGDRVLHEVATELGLTRNAFASATPSVCTSASRARPSRLPDPFFDRRRTERTGCTLCGGCMIGCRVGAKNTLDRNYLYLAASGAAGAARSCQRPASSISGRSGPPKVATGIAIVTERSTG